MTTPRSIIAVALIAILATASHGLAQDSVPNRIAIESYSGARPPEARRAMAILRGLLARRRFVSDPAALQKLIGERKPVAMDRDLTTRAFARDIDAGENLYIDASYRAAAARLGTALDGAARNPLILRESQSREMRLKGLVLLALSHGRLSREPYARDAPAHARARDAAMLELLRSYPNKVITVKEFGPEAVQLARSVTDAIAKIARGRLAVIVDDPDVAIYVNEIPRGNGKVELGDLMPGRYRVLLEPTSGAARVFEVDVLSNHEARLRVDWEVASVLVASDDYVGFSFDTGPARRHEGELARRFAHAYDGVMVAVLSAELVNHRLAVVGSLYSVWNGQRVRHGMVELSRPDDTARLEQLAAYLDPSSHQRPTQVAAGPPDDYTAVPLERVHDVQDPDRSGDDGGAAIARRRAPAAPPADTRSRHLREWLLAGSGIAVGGLGVYLLAIDGSSACGEPSACRTQAAGWVALGAGTAALAGAVWLHLRHPSPPAPTQPLLLAAPLDGGVLGAVTWRF